MIEVDMVGQRCSSVNARSGKLMHGYFYSRFHPPCHLHFLEVLRLTHRGPAHPIEMLGIYHRSQNFIGSCPKAYGLPRHQGLLHQVAIYQLITLLPHLNTHTPSPSNTLSARSLQHRGKHSIHVIYLALDNTFLFGLLPPLRPRLLTADHSQLRCPIFSPQDQALHPPAAQF